MFDSKLQDALIGFAETPKRRVMATPSTLVAIRDVYNSVPFGWRLICHSLVVASWFRQDFLRQRWLLSYWVCVRLPPVAFLTQGLICVAMAPSSTSLHVKWYCG